MSTSANRSYRPKAEALFMLRLTAIFLFVGPAQATTVLKDGAVATGITDLRLGSNTYNVAFFNQSAADLYPAEYEFENDAAALVAVEAIITVLNAEGGILGVGESAASPFEDFSIPYDETFVDFDGVNIPFLKLAEGYTGDPDQPGVWAAGGLLDRGKLFTPDMYAKFTLISEDGAGNSPPVADAGGPYIGAANQDVTFDGSGSSDLDGNIVQYEWDFGTVNSGGETVNYSYSSGGYYNVTLTVTDDTGATDSDSTVVEIGQFSIPPVADTGGPYFGTAGKAIQFDGTGSTDPDGNIEQWTWDFGDTQFNGPQPSRSYGAPGIYTVTLTVFDNSGESDRAIDQVIIAEGNSVPLAAAGGPYIGIKGVAIKFDGSGSSDSDGDIVSYQWDFGDGNLGAGVSPLHTYSEDGNYSVSLTITDDEGAINTAFTTVAVNPNVQPGVTDFPSLIEVADLNNDGATELAVLRNGSTLVDIRDGSGGSLLNRIEFFDDTFTPVSFAALPDTDSNLEPEIAVVARRATDGQTTAEIRNTGNLTAPRRIGFRDGVTPISVRVIEGYGTPQLALLGIRDSDGRGLVEIKNAIGDANTITIWVGEGLTPRNLAIVPDADDNGVPEIAVLSTRDSDSRMVVEVRNTTGDANLNRLFFREGNTPINLAILPDKDSDDVPEVAVLSRRTSDGRNAVETKNAYGEAGLTTLWFREQSTALDLEAVDDADNNGVPELAVMSRRDSDGRVLVEIKNAAGDSNLVTRFYSDGFTALDLATFDELDGNTVPESAVLLVRQSDGQFLVQSRNAAGDELPRNYWFSL